MIEDQQKLASLEAATENAATETVPDAATLEAVTIEPVTIESEIADLVGVQLVGVELPEASDEPVQRRVTAAERQVVQATPPALNTDSDKPANEQPANEQPAGFAGMSLHRSVQESLELAGYKTPTEIQQEIIPHMLAGRDVLAQSQTGSGKTAAFALPILTNLDVNRRSPQVLVLAPTRELAIQVAKSFSTYGANLKGFAVAAIYGGQDYEPQLKQLRRGVQVVVGTPGRVIDHVKRGTLDLGSIDCLVLDEADEMLNMGFLEDVQFVLSQAPPTRQVALFSATLPGPIRDISQEYLNDPAHVTIKNKTMTADSIRQRALFVPPREKIPTLKRFLEVEDTDGVIVFTKTKDATIVVADSLVRDGFSAVALNGDMPQKTRERTIEQLKAGRLNVLVATDVAARGLDVSRISHVFNFDLPHDSESYIHRVGRTGRAGRSGEAIIFLTNAQRGKLRLIERATKQPIEVVQAPTADDINAHRVEKFKQRITDVTAGQDLTLFKELIASYAEETEKPMEMIAAALAQIAQRGRPFFVKDTGKPKREPRQRQSDDFGERDRGFPDERPSRGRRPRGVEAGMQRYRIEVGYRDGVKPGNIVGAVANEAGLDGSDIGPIDIRDSFSTIDLPEGMPRTIYDLLQDTWVAGKQLRIRTFDDDDSRGSQHYGRSGGGKGQHRGGPRRFSGGQGKPGGKPKMHRGKPGRNGKPKKHKAKS